MQTTPHIAGRTVLVYALISLWLSFALSEALLQLKDFILKRVQKREEKLEKKAGKFVFGKSDMAYFLSTALVIFICWIPVWLAFYPGLFAYDVISQIQQVKTLEYTTHHPLLHTLGLGFFYEVLGGRVFKDYTLGIAAASLFQMAVFALQLSYTHLFLRRLGSSRIIRALLIAFCGLCPFFSVLAVSMTKDVIFAGFLGLLVTSMSYFEVDYSFACNKKSVKVMLFISIMGTMLFRSNGRYAVFAMAVVLLIKCICQKKKTLIIVTLSAIALSELLGLGLKKGLNAKAPDPNEMLSIPFQQMAFVYEVNYENLSAEDKQIIETLIPDVINYNRIIADPIKFTGQYVDNKDLFWKTYIRFFKAYPRQYMEAFMQTNMGFLGITDKTNATIYGVGYERRRGFLMTYTRDGYGIEQVSKIPWLEDLYLKLYCQNDYQKNLLTFLPCSMGLYFWLIALSALYMLINKSKCAATMVLVLALGATTLLGPCAIIRYLLPYVVTIPILWADVSNS